MRTPEQFRYWLFWMALIVILAIFPVFAWHEGTDGFLTDDGMYLLLADFFSPYYDGNYFVEHFIATQSRHPPAFPVLIALAGGGSTNMAIAHLVASATFIASAVVFYAWAFRTLASRELAVACLAIYALLPKTLIYVMEIWSEHLYMTFVFTAFICLDIANRHRRPVHAALWTCSLFVGLAMLTRMIGLALLAAFVVFLYRHRVKRSYLYVATAIVLPVCWQLIKVAAGYGASYTDDIQRYLSWDGLAVLFLSDIPHNASLLFQSWGKHFSVAPDEPWYLKSVSGLLLVLALAGAARRGADRCTDFFYVVFYLAIVLAWPYPDHATRFLYPLVPLALVYMFLGLRLAIGGVDATRRPLANGGLVLLMLLMIYPNALFMVDRFLAPAPDHIRDDYRHTRVWFKGDDVSRAYRASERKQTVVRLIRRLDEYVAPHECIYAIHPISTMLYSKRKSIMLPEGASSDKLKHCRYLFVMNLVGEFGPNYPLHDMNPDKLSLLDAELDSRGRPQAFLFEITP